MPFGAQACADRRDGAPRLGHRHAPSRGWAHPVRGTGMRPAVPAGGYICVMPSAPQDEPDAAPPVEQPAERYGPLNVARMRKEDGRALIRFERAEPPGQA
jgi:hypothetical protein